MKLRLRPTIGWICAVLVAGFHALALYGKLVPPVPGSAGDQFAIAVGMRGMEYQLGVLEALIVILFLIPRTMTVGFVLMVGYFGGILGASLTHGFPHADLIVIYVSLVILTISAWGRNPELLTRVMGRPIKA